MESSSRDVLVSPSSASLSSSVLTCRRAVTLHFSSPCNVAFGWIEITFTWAFTARRVASPVKKRSTKNMLSLDFARLLSFWEITCQYKFSGFCYDQYFCEHFVCNNGSLYNLSSCKKRDSKTNTHNSFCWFRLQHPKSSNNNKWIKLYRISMLSS